MLEGYDSETNKYDVQLKFIAGYIARLAHVHM